jgi:hypothetical protein
MSHAYKSLEDGQIVVSEEPRPDLEELARWVSVEAPEPEKKLTAAEKRAAKAELATAGVDPADVDDAATGAVELAEVAE